MHWWDWESANLIWGPGWDQINLREPQTPGQREVRFQTPRSFSSVWPLVPSHPTISCLLCVSPSAPRLLCPTTVPFQESPSMQPGDGDPGHRAGSAPALLRANSDTSMALPDWMVFCRSGDLVRGAPAPPQGPRASAATPPPAPSSAAGPCGVPAAPGCRAPLPVQRGGTPRRPSASPVDGPGRGGLSPGLQTPLPPESPPGTHGCPPPPPGQPRCPPPVPETAAPAPPPRCIQLSGPHLGPPRSPS